MRYSNKYLLQVATDYCNHDLTYFNTHSFEEMDRTIITCFKTWDKTVLKSLDPNYSKVNKPSLKMVYGLLKLFNESTPSLLSFVKGYVRPDVKSS